MVSSGLCRDSSECGIVACPCAMVSLCVGRGILGCHGTGIAVQGPPRCRISFAVTSPPQLRAVYIPCCSFFPMWKEKAQALHVSMELCFTCSCQRLVHDLYMQSH